MSSVILDKFSSPSIGEVKNRIVMAAMTRGFANESHCATEKMKAYYERRAKNGVGLIITEGVVIHSSADGYNSVPHIETMKQAESWRPIAEAVHSHGSKIFCQLWHCGRISHKDYTNGVAPVSSTNRPASGINRQNGKPFGTPTALTNDGILTVYNQYVSAAKNALSVGFDGVQLHLGHGYLADQFFDSRINDRTDEYGGTIENRCRFSLNLIERMMQVTDSNQIMVRISPSREMDTIYDWPDLDPMLEYLIPKMWDLGVRNLDISCANADYYKTSGRCIRKVRKMWPGVLIGGASLQQSQAEEEIENGRIDLVTWGRYLIANPDLPQRIQSGAVWNEFSREMLADLY